MTDRELLAQIARSAGGKAGYKQLVRELGLGGGRERRLLLEQLARLTARGDLAKTRSRTLEHPQKIHRRHPRQPRRRPPRPAPRRLRLRPPQCPPGDCEEDDVFIPPNEINGAMQGDQVLVEVEPPRADGRRQGRIARILERRNPTVVGIFHYARCRSRNGPQRRPLRRAHDPAHPHPSRPGTAPRPTKPPLRIAFSAAKPPPHTRHHDDLEGLVVDVEITSWPTPTRPPVGRVIEVLGDPDDFGVDVEMMIRKHQLPAHLS